MDSNGPTKKLPVPQRDPKTKKFVSLGETEETLSAFEFYYQLGERRSYAKVARQCNTNIVNVRRWSRRFRWKDRIKERLLAFADKLEQATTVQTIGVRAQYSNEFAKMVQDFLVYIEQMKKEYIQDMKDYKVARKMYDELVRLRKPGEPLPTKPKRPRPFAVIKYASDLERIVKLHLLMLGETADRPGPSEMLAREKRLEASMEQDESIKDLIMETWRRTRSISVPPYGKAPPLPEKHDTV